LLLPLHLLLLLPFLLVIPEGDLLLQLPLPLHLPLPLPLHFLNRQHKTSSSRPKAALLPPQWRDPRILLLPLQLIPHLPLQWNLLLPLPLLVILSEAKNPCISEGSEATRVPLLLGIPRLQPWVSQ
jgi:hypothetical protein